MARSRADSVLPHPLLVDAARAAIRDGAHERFDEYVTTAERNLLTRVVNATGVLLHTNMGRAPLAIERAAGYSNLELDLQTGERGSRQDRAGALLARACGAEAAIVVNNCAAAVMLGLAAVARGGAVPVSRGELVEIGGGFRVPEVLEQSGCRLIEVGTTNRTRIGDFERALHWRGKFEALEWLIASLARARAATEALTFVYRDPGARGDARAYLIVRGEVRACYPDPVTPLEREAFEAVVAEERSRPAEPVGRIDPERLHQRLLIMSWFRTHPDAWRRTAPLESWQGTE